MPARDSLTVSRRVSAREGRVYVCAGGDGSQNKRISWRGRKEEEEKVEEGGGCLGG